MNTFCTIITRSHIPYARALFQSLSEAHESAELNVLVVDFKGEILPEAPGLVFHDGSSLIQQSQVGQALHQRFLVTRNWDQLRWSLKPIFINHLFELGFSKVIFSDPDTFYFGDFSFLFEELDTSRVLLTPHWRGSNPKADLVNFELQFLEGIFNAGFIGVSQKATDVMSWWAECCLNKCEKDPSKGQYVDQTYLNLMPVYFDGVKALKHRGCNVSAWNLLECRRVLVGNEVSINEEWPLIFIHFTRSTIRAILEGADPLLKPQLDAYVAALQQYGVDLTNESETSRAGSSHTKDPLNWFRRFLIQARGRQE
jgi:hypothetical protein